MAKRYLEEHGLPYREVDIINDKRGRQEMVRMTGQYGVPVIRVGERAMTGWDKAEFERLLHGRGRGAADSATAYCDIPDGGSTNFV